MPSPAQPLSVEDHRRDASGMTYVYPVVSRRAGGVSIGINLNPNQACNWRCVYCQVPNLKRGGPPPLDLQRLEQELATLLEWTLHGDFMERHVPADCRVLSDIAFSGDGEPTSAPEFAVAVERIIAIARRYDSERRIKLRLITNGSLLDRVAVRDGLACLGAAGGEVWLKVDAATEAGIARINGSRQKPDTVRRRLIASCELCPTWVQSCFFGWDDAEPAPEAVDVYVDFVASVATRIDGVHLYGIARESHQPEGRRLRRLDFAWFEALARRLRMLGLTVKVSP